MSAQIFHLRDKLPADMYSMLQKFLSGELISLQVTALGADQKIKHYSFGKTPTSLAEIAENKPTDLF